MLDVIVATPQELLFEGAARQIICPGEQGVFEIGPFHRPLMSRLLPGVVVIDGQAFPIHRGVLKVDHDRVIAIVEPEVAESAPARGGCPAPPSPISPTDRSRD